MRPKNIFYTFAVRLPKRAYNLVFRCDWRPIRFLMALVFFGSALVQIKFALSPNMLALASFVYFCASISSIVFGGFYLFVSTSDSAENNSRALEKRYLVELSMFLVWIWVAYIDWYAYTNGMIKMDPVSWQHHIIINVIISLTLFCAFLNAISLAENVKNQEIGEGNG